MTIGRSLCISAFLAATSLSAAAATTIPGGDIASQTWTAAGSPYVLTGDVTIKPGVTLHVDPGVVVQLAASDGLASGTDPARVELIVQGTLEVTGTVANPVRFASTGTKGAWWGIQVAGTATTARFEHVAIADAVTGLSTSAAGAALTALDLTSTNNTYYGVYVAAGSPQFDGLIASGDHTAVQVLDATPSFVRSVIRGDFDVYAAAQRDIALANCTFTGAVHVAQPSTLAVTNAVFLGATVTADAGAAISIAYADLWNTTLANVTSGPGVFVANPIVVSASNLRLTANSPARFRGSDGHDLGALPYAGDATPGLRGTLWANTRFTAGGSYTVDGDLTVPTGVTLTIDPGAVVRFSDHDALADGDTPALTELRIAGAVISHGGELTSSAVPGAWAGVRLLAGATGSQLGLRIRYAGIGIWLLDNAANANDLRGAYIDQPELYGVYVTGGAPTIDGVEVHNYTEIGGQNAGISVRRATPSITNVVVSAGERCIETWTETASTIVVANATLVDCKTGVYANGQATVAVVNSILAATSTYAFYAEGAAIAASFVDLWHTGSTGVGVTFGAGVLSVDPQFEGATAKLQLGSPLIDVGTATGAPGHDIRGAVRPLDGDGVGGAAYDLGAYELVRTPGCGDGLLEAGEVCDDGTANGTYGHCRADCSGVSGCGNGVVESPELCDDGNAANDDACLATCVAASCGDGFVETGLEECDDGNALPGDACTDHCLQARCGDGIVELGVEACDDGNAANDDACVAACHLAMCGDGYVRAATEACDDGNTIDTDGCRNDCALPTCGDGIVDPAEQCDDGNADNADGCRNNCIAPSCGDGVVDAGEQCDDGNTDDGDACRNGCRLPHCGDGAVDPGEECDDANDRDGDGCSASCTAETADGEDDPAATAHDGCSAGGQGTGGLVIAAVLALVRRRRRGRAR